MTDPPDTDPGGIACWQRIDPRITTSGKLTGEDCAALASLGVRHVINLALADSPGALADEAELLEALGLTYTHIPVPFDAPEERHFAAFRDAMAGADDAPVHVHCILNWRVSAFLYRYNRDVAGMAEADAQAIMRHQWWPPESDHKDAPAWATFIGRPFPA